MRQAARISTKGRTDTARQGGAGGPAIDVRASIAAPFAASVLPGCRIAASRQLGSFDCSAIEEVSCVARVEA
jgi:hypothetical protein